MKKLPKTILGCTLVLLIGLNGCRVNKQAETLQPSEPTHTETVKPTNTTDVSTKDYLDIGFQLMGDEMNFILNNALSDETIVSQLGEPEGKSEAVVWAADALEHQAWYYNSKGLELGFVRNGDDSQVVNSVRIFSLCTLKTSRNIGIGSTKEKVLKAYEYEIDTENGGVDASSITAGTVYGGVIFEIEKGLVSRVFIGAAAE